MGTRRIDLNRNPHKDGFAKEAETTRLGLNTLLVDSIEEVWAAYKKSGLDPKMIEYIKKNYKESDVCKTKEGKIIWHL